MPVATKTRPTATPVLETFHTVSEAAVRLNLRKPEDTSKKGEKWLRDGVNRPEDGTKGTPFPCHRLAGQLLFSDSDLAAIADMHRNQRDGRSGPRKRRVYRTVKAVS
ncbi:hypothetical protein OG814_33140 [Streptomyces zaomyceticus]|uniref:DNA-binding protein n=1 Tax=Streptomyces zaomyceticus TaxID=68286 RepID=A0ABZ1LK98_9ACTN